MFFTLERRGPPVRAQADELPRGLPRLRVRSAAPTATCRCAWPSSASCRATSARGCCTGSCGSAPSPRTTRTSICTLDQVTDEVDVDLRGDRRALRALRIRPRCGSSSRPGPTSRIGTDEQWERAEGALREALASQGREYEVSPARAPSTGRRSTSTSPTRSAAPGSAAPASSTSSCPSASTSPTGRPTTPSTGR